MLQSGAHLRRIIGVRLLASLVVFDVLRVGMVLFDTSSYTSTLINDVANFAWRPA
jgi:hypothetical protein